MDPAQLKQYLEFYRDLGMKSVFTGGPPAGTGSHVALTTASAAPAAPTSVPPALTTASPASTIPTASAAPEEPLVRKSVKPSDLFPKLFPVGSADDSLEKIREDIGDCQRCRLCATRTKIVFGDGNDRARLVFIGEGPGADEDAQGLPFIGKAGQLLTQMIENTASKEGLTILRPDVYICNVVKCRPPGNRTPEPDEMEVCGQFLMRQLLVLKPRAICALGATATKALLGTKEGIMKLRGRWQHWRDIPVMPTYHPSYLLRSYNQNAKRETWEDLKKVLHYVYDEPERPLSDF